MKAITVKQPWASLIVHGIKDIENRTWSTKFRGRVLIHAAKKEDTLAIDVISCFDGETARKLWFDINDNKLPLGSIIGSVEIVDCVINYESIWAQKSSKETTIYNWVLANPILFPEPILAKGKLSFWDYPNILAEPEEEGGKLFCHCNLPIDESIQILNLASEFRCRYCNEIWYK